MAEILGAASSATKLFLEVNRVSIDNWTFKLFYKATSTILIVFSALSGSKQFFGSPINCDLNGRNHVAEEVLNTYCWMYSTMNIPLEFRGSCSKREYDGTTLYNSYYQWVALYLVFSAVLFYTPRAVWLMAEGGLMKFLAKGTTSKIVEDAEEKRDHLIKTFRDHLHNKYNTYALWFFICEQLNLLFVICEWLLTNVFLRYRFMMYGPRVIQYYNLPVEERTMYMTNPMCEAFPRIASCDFIRYGSGGGQERANAICVLGLNMINDKIFLVLWFWYLFLVLFGLTRLLYRILQLSSHRFRYLVMKVRIHRYFKSDSGMVHVANYVKQASIGDWFVLYQMSRNINTRFFAEFLVVLSRMEFNRTLESDEDLEGEHMPFCPSDMEVPSMHISCVDSDLSLAEKQNVLKDGFNHPEYGILKRRISEISLHSTILDLHYDECDGVTQPVSVDQIEKSDLIDLKSSAEEKSSPKTATGVPPHASSENISSSCSSRDDTSENGDSRFLRKSGSKKRGSTVQDKNSDKFGPTESPPRPQGHLTNTSMRVVQQRIAK